jgi:transcription termination factor Rho
VVVSGPARSGKSEALRRIALALAPREDLEVMVVLAGVRPEEIGEWRETPAEPVGATSFAASADAQAGAVEQAVEQGRRIAARGRDAVVIIDAIDGLSPAVARRTLAAARNIVDGGSLTVIAASDAPLGGETTVVALDASLAAARQWPAIDRTATGTMRADVLIGESAAAELARALVEEVE